ncbi:hypothetical protein CEXT_645021 [Caerostris extrusa]|uniref:Uncharacterized protein n=1 Tax=Caerostris extrusa TaxID=172846 RepID=A0AAV4T8N5_CAEEX|nr:hypothetical protein CEXT_645021 [Caerostris extrusa]
MGLRRTSDIKLARCDLFEMPPPHADFMSSGDDSYKFGWAEGKTSFIKKLACRWIDMPRCGQTCPNKCFDGLHSTFWVNNSCLVQYRFLIVLKNFVALSLVRGLFSAVTGERRRLRMGWKGLCTSFTEIPFDCSFLISHDYLSQVRWSQAERRDPLRFCHQTVAGVPWRTVGGHSSGWWAPTMSVNSVYLGWNCGVHKGVEKRSEVAKYLSQ